MQGAADRSGRDCFRATSGRELAFGWQLVLLFANPGCQRLRCLTAANACASAVQRAIARNVSRTSDGRSCAHRVRELVWPVSRACALDWRSVRPARTFETVDAPAEVEYFIHGGILQMVLRELLAA
jgi:hypothetical protein